MRFLKPLKSKVEPNERSRAVAKMEGHLHEWLEEPIEKQEKFKSYINGVRNVLADLRSVLKKKGDATKITAYGLPIQGGKNNPKRENVWWIPEAEWASTTTFPLKLSVTRHSLDADPDLEDWDEDGEEAEIFQLWILDGVIYLALDRNLAPEDVVALIKQDRNARRLALEKAHALQAMAEQLDKPRRRERLPQEVRLEVWQRDKGRCVECGNQENLEFDHIIPFAMGGSNTARNLQLLCGDCNRRKGMTLG